MKKKTLSHVKLKKGNSNIDRVVTIYWKLKDSFSTHFEIVTIYWKWDSFLKKMLFGK